MARSLTQRVWFTLGALAVWRLGSHIPLPGIDHWALRQALSWNELGLLVYPDLLSGGGLGQLSVVALGPVPYFAALLIVLLLSWLWKPWNALWRAGVAGRQKLPRYPRIGTLLIAIVQSFSLVMTFERLGAEVMLNPGLVFVLTIMGSLTAGALFLMWLGEQITRFGVGRPVHWDGRESEKSAEARKCAAWIE